jgi:hypothetical protein
MVLFNIGYYARRRASAAERGRSDYDKYGG